ncbi:MAG: family 1 glycosylhydrolase [Chloroflexota bacterium]
MAKARMVFPTDFRWGTATSSYQVEGNNQNSDWWAWEQQAGTIVENGRSALASNWWENAETDLDAAAEMGTNAHRLSLEWSRIEPEPSVFDEAVLQRYRDILQGMVDRDIEPMVTLHHFSNPLWLVEKGDFNSQIVVDYFERYVAKVVSVLGDLVPLWITINEPLVYIFLRYLDGKFPEPGKKGFRGAREAFRYLLECHTRAYHTIKEAYPTAQVGVAKQQVIFEGRLNGNGLDRWQARRATDWFNEAWMGALMNGRLRQPFGRGQIQHLADSFDFVGLNYYTRLYLRFSLAGNWVEQDWGPNAIVSDGHYGEVYPYGLYRLIENAVQKYKKPIFITENGVPDAADKLRPAFILDHLRQIWHAISWCYPVMGYYHWSLVDNFEWDRGWTQRFGLIELNPETQERQWRRSAHLYQAICQSRSLSDDMAATYAPEMLSVMFPGERPVISHQ